MDDLNNTQSLVLSDKDLVILKQKESVADWIKRNSQPYKRLMSYYSCALMEVETKFNVLSEDLSLRDDRNPIEAIRTRMKTPESIMNKLIDHQLPLTIDSIEQNINDIAGIRVICTFKSDIYNLADMFLSQDDVTLVRKKDYIEEPKDNGYRSLHLIVSVPIFLHDEKRMMKVEVQMRTLAMDLWASTEHKISYKDNTNLTDDNEDELHECAELCSLLDRRLENIYKQSKGQNSI